MCVCVCVCARALPELEAVLRLFAGLACKKGGEKPESDRERERARARERERESEFG